MKIKNSARGLWSLFAVSSFLGMPQLLLADAPRALPPDPLGLAPYVSTFAVPASDALEAWSENPETSVGRFTELRLDEKTPVRFFHGPVSQNGKFDSKSQEGVAVDLQGYFRHRLESAIAGYEKTRRQDEERARKIEDQLYQIERGRLNLSKAEIEDLRDELRNLENERKELLRKAISLQNLSKDHPDRINKAIEESVSVVHTALAAMLRRCYWEGSWGKAKKIQAISYVGTSCQAAPASAMLVALDNVMEHDQALDEKGEPYSLFKTGALLGNPGNQPRRILSRAREFFVRAVRHPGLRLLFRQQQRQRDHHV